ncbi:family 43 glycosylhydrolase [Pseudanabaenaceae cyanobacterium LEGE 13415]|nr:family 43 glycosylhydrolase [Pseudanabaenaceae cyanobacterium LEGE 13415]
MNLNRIHHGIVSLIEPIPTGASELQKISILERGGIRIGNSIAQILRSFLKGAPMNWDPWILKDDDRYLMFYLQGIEGQTPWWSFSHLCGAMSKDLYHWEDLGILLAPSEQPWESGRISAGHTVKENGTYYLFYSAGGKEGRELKSEGIGLATSTDGIHWERQYTHFPLIPSDDDLYYGRCNWTKHFHWRDPYIFKDPKSGQYFMFTCASSKTPGNFQGCVGLAVSDTIDGNYQLLPPVVAPPPNGKDWGFYHLERPQVIYRNNQYHLFFSCFRMFQNQQWLHKHPRGRITNSSLHWYVSDRITGPFLPVEQNQSIIPGSETSGLYGTNLLETSNPDEYIAYGWYHRLHVLEVSPRYRVRWTGNGYEMGLANRLQFPHPSGKLQPVSESIP